MPNDFDDDDDTEGRMMIRRVTAGLMARDTVPSLIIAPRILSATGG